MTRSLIFQTIFDVVSLNSNLYLRSRMRLKSLSISSIEQEEAWKGDISKMVESFPIKNEKLEQFY